MLLTGAGTSAIYQPAALIIPGPAVVVLPLITLQRDQVAAMLPKGVDRRGQLPGRAAARGQAFDDLVAGDLES